MNANSPSQIPTINDWLNNASNKLSGVNIPSSKLDAELILASCLNKNRTYLHAHNNKILTIKSITMANNKLKLRLKRIPIAYITGYKEFYGRQFIVTSNTLIPRPESETIIELLNKIIKPNSNSQIPIAKLIDIGTGSGCLGITAKLEHPTINVTLTDISKPALKIAKKNAHDLRAKVKFINDDLLHKCIEKFDVIIANLPYVDNKWDRSPETSHEPSLALFADDNGLYLIKKLIRQVVVNLNPNGYLIIEADPLQHKEIIKFASKYSYSLFNQKDYIITLKLKYID